MHQTMNLGVIILECNTQINVFWCETFYLHIPNSQYPDIGQTEVEKQNSWPLHGTALKWKIFY